MRDRKPMSTRLAESIVKWMKPKAVYHWYNKVEILMAMPEEIRRDYPGKTQWSFGQALSHAVKLLPAHGWTAERRRGKHGWEYRFSRLIHGGQKFGKTFSSLAFDPSTKKYCQAKVDPNGKIIETNDLGDGWIMLTAQCACGQTFTMNPKSVFTTYTCSCGRDYELVKEDGKTRIKALPNGKGVLHVAPPVEEYKCREIMDPKKWMTQTFDEACRNCKPLQEDINKFIVENSISKSDARKRLLDIVTAAHDGGPLSPAAAMTALTRVLNYIRELEG